MGCTESKPKESQPQKATRSGSVKAEPKYNAAIASLSEKGLSATTATLNQACKKDEVDTVTLCLQAGVDPNEHESDDVLQKCPLHYAAEFGRERVLEVLLRNKASPAKRNAISETAMHLAASGAHAGCIEILAKAKRELVDSVDGQGQTPLFMTVYSAEERGGGAMDTLVRLGADVNARNKHRETPLHAAVKKNNRSTATHVLIKHGALVNAQDQHGSTPLHRAAQEEANNPLSILLESGADSTIKDKSGNTPLDIAKRWQYASTVALIEQKTGFHRGADVA